MAPNSGANASSKAKNTKKNYTKGNFSSSKNKRKTWNPDNKFFDGSLQEGQGFAFQRKQKIQHEYKKLLRKQRWIMQDSKPQMSEDYPEHLKHLYIAEQERLDEEEKIKRNRRMRKSVCSGEEEAQTLEQANSSASTGATDTVTKPAAAAVPSNEQPGRSQYESSPQQVTPRQRRQKKVSSFQKMKQEHERVKEERERKREEYLKDKAQREEALKKYKEKKKETYQLLKKKTKKGQPNLNLQMELLLQKIQTQCK